MFYSPRCLVLVNPIRERSVGAGHVTREAGKNWDQDTLHSIVDSLIYFLICLKMHNLAIKLNILVLCHI